MRDADLAPAIRAAKPMSGLADLRGFAPNRRAHAFDVIIVHSYSRFFREAFEQEFYLRKLAKHNVKVVSITQPVGDENEPVHAMMRKVIALFDEYQSRENAKHVIRSMKENARQGFWNGSTVPLGYRLVEVERRGTKIKKKLDVDPVEAEYIC